MSFVVRWKQDAPAAGDVSPEELADSGRPFLTWTELSVHFRGAAASYFGRAAAYARGKALEEA